MRRLPALAALLSVAVLASCGDRDHTLAPDVVRAGIDGPTSALVVEADPGIARLDVRIDDAYGTRDAELVREDKEGLLAGAIELAPGGEAKLAFHAYDADGNATHEGEGAITVGKEVTPQQELALVPVPGADDASVRIGSYRLALTPAVIAGEPGKAYDMQATLVDAYGKPRAIEKGSLELAKDDAALGVGSVSFGWGDDGTIDDMLVPMRWFVEKWYTGRMKICHWGDGTCGQFFLIDVTPVIQLAAGEHHTCALRRSGQVRCWGRAGDDALGRGSFGFNLLAAFSFTSISSYLWHNCGVDTTGKVRCWGQNSSGALGQPISVTSSPFPNEVPGLPAPARTVTAGQDFSCALLTNGETWCWGDNFAGQLGDSTATGPYLVSRSVRPVRVKGGVTFTAIAAGRHQSCGLDAAGAAWCWGRNDDGQAGVDPAAGDQCPMMRTTPSPSVSQLSCAAVPRRVASPEAFTEVSGGHEMSCARAVSGAGYCWGLPYFTSSPPGSSKWTARALPGSLRWKSFLAGYTMQCGIDTGDMVECFGYNGSGQLGRGTTSVPNMTPAPVALTDVWTLLELGISHACAVRAGGSVVSCWGSNGRGQLGAVTPSGFSSVPVNVTVPY